MVAENLITAEQIETVLGLYNYWIVIFLMMTGFYIVIARNNLVKTVIGLNVFQISVILLYITMGKVSGGTAPIVPPSMVSHGHADHGHHDHSDHDDHSAHDEHSHHENHGLSTTAAHALTSLVTDTDEHAPGHSAHHDHAADDGHHPATAAGRLSHGSESHAEQKPILYSNALPSVLMLTAIVVGVATTALALALIVRIREDYGTIEEDEILKLDGLEPEHAA
jgi:multicomponent Na+:H+ antiporter subunit C